VIASKVKAVGASEAKTHLVSLRKQVAQGNKDVFERIRALRGTIVLPKGETAKDLINAGRRI
jgi:hypothetical protein